MQVLLLASIGLLLFGMPLYGQNLNTDSAKLVLKITEDHLKLEKLQRQLKEKMDDKQGALDEAQRSARRNSRAADKLREDPDNKKLARKAHRNARNARKESRNARKEAARLEELNKDIENLKNRIAENQMKLDKYIQDSGTNHVHSDTLRL